MMLMLLIHLHGDVHHRVSPVPPGGLAATAKALANADPIVSIGSHPHEVTRGFRQPLNPSHGFKHLIDVAWRGIICGVVPNSALNVLQKFAVVE